MDTQYHGFHIFPTDPDWLYDPYKSAEESINNGCITSAHADHLSESQSVQTGFTQDLEWTTPLTSDEGRYTCRERRRRKRASAQYRRAHAARERLRVEAFNQAFSQLRTLLPVGLICGSAQSERRLSKLQVLRLCSVYIFSLTQLLYENTGEINQWRYSCP
ncbi:hypothetical protein FGIG_10735 [Fasciola gigantica]|uniref:BHLH domain-containing protein n=1 Tax=Fasciola gigantica TaxID=46835 RepID=A0A504YJH1_FASGI|nr:hypothetical protein FGIG_10735 [Fasciola gigantica]